MSFPQRRKDAKEISPNYQKIVLCALAPLRENTLSNNFCYQRVNSLRHLVWCGSELGVVLGVVFSSGVREIFGQYSTHLHVAVE